ncbi:hypothetical protein [Massilia aquatica]|uniref:Uncharacterized protein n=1 Tax=Massilia aquatica TaxID=2609000 RepID=A0ABX0MJN9_9BURK|nr:hypothetical protein [Massilia aquatica]NHZ42381.1 hypothetical protein [Massilia aquatica]
MNLNDETVRKAQLKNIARFRRPQLYFLIGFGGALATIAYADHTSNNSFVLFLIAFSLIVFAVISLMRYRCPNCGNLPFAVAGETDQVEARVTAGVALFPAKCKCCGYYLSKRRLKQDSAS